MPMIQPRHTAEELSFAQPCRTKHIGLRVNIYADMPHALQEGDMITLTGEVIGLENREVDLQWQVDDGGTWKDVPGATGLTYSFEATQQSVNLSWRLSVTARRRW